MTLVIGVKKSVIVTKGLFKTFCFHTHYYRISKMIADLMTTSVIVPSLVFVFSEADRELRVKLRGS